MRKLGIEDDKYVNFTYHFKDDNDYYRINFRDPELDSKCIKKDDIYKMNMSEFLDRFSVFNSEEDCYENRDKVNHLCDYFLIFSKY